MVVKDSSPGLLELGDKVWQLQPLPGTEQTRYKSLFDLDQFRLPRSTGTREKTSVRGESSEGLSC